MLSIEERLLTVKKEAAHSAVKWADVPKYNNTKCVIPEDFTKLTA